MSKKLVEGYWVIECDWEGCDLGHEGRAAQFVDPEGGKNPDSHFQCGRHHGIIPQEEKPEFQLPEDHKLNQEVFTRDAEEITVEEVEENE